MFVGMQDQMINNQMKLVKIIRFHCAVGVNGTWHLLADTVQGPSGPIHQLLRDFDSLRPRDKQHLGPIQQVLELGLVLCPVPRHFKARWQRKTSKDSKKEREKEGKHVRMFGNIGIKKQQCDCFWAFHFFFLRQIVYVLVQSCVVNTCTKTNSRKKDLTVQNEEIDFEL